MRSLTRPKALLAIGLLVALVSTAVAIAVFSIRFSNQQADLQDHNVTFAVAIANASLHAKGMANDERGYLLSGAPRYREQIEQRLLNVRTAFAAATIAAGGETQSQAVAEAHAGFEDWVWALQSELKTFDSGERKRATEASFETLRPLRKQYESSLARASAVASTAIQQRRYSFASSQWVITFLAFLVVVLSIGVVALFSLTRALTPADDAVEPEPLEQPIPLHERLASRR
jgi:methyl-accepting chemotaxis protein